MKKSHRHTPRSGIAAALTALAAFTVQAQVTLNPDSRVTADASKPGFIWRVFNHPANQTTDNQRTEDALAGLLRAAEGTVLPNRANPAAQGVALAPASPPSPANAPITFEIATVINLNQTEGGVQGTFTPDDQMPGIPGTDGSTDGTAAEILTYLELEPGTYTMGVASDDGFRTRGGSLTDAFQGVLLGEFNGGRGTAETLFSFTVTEAGVYPFRTTYQEGGGASDIEWYSLKADGSKVLINDVARGGIKAFRALSDTAPRPPHVRSVIPSPVPRQANVVASELVIVLSDGDLAAIDDTSIDFKVDGKAVTTRKREGKTVTLTYTPDGIRFPSESHSASLSFQAAGGFVRAENWVFRNLKSVVLPATPVAGENFDTTQEGQQPTGWVPTNFSVDCFPDEDNFDVMDQKSDAFKNWVVISTETMPRIDDAGIREVNASERLNGQKLTLDLLRSKNVLYAESDGRCTGDSPTRPVTEPANYGQVQFIVSKPYNLAAVKNPVLSFSSGYMQNQDSYGGCEYSVDGGATWMPVVYFLDLSDILLRPDGTIDGPGTLNAPQTDTAIWTDNGVVQGNTYGSALAAPINDEIGNYIVPRINDDNAEGKRVEIFRLPTAANQPDVRLRFSATGTDSWYWYIDNVALYDIAPAVIDPGSLNLPTISGSNLVLSWTGAGILQHAAGAAGPWTDSTAQSNPQNVPLAGAAARFFRLRH